ncbi:unnamed protein product, partial [Durusdinium trenchii]
VSYVKFPTVHPFVDSKQGRRMQASDLMSQLAPDAFTCPGEAGEGCVLPRSFVNDRKCDCPGTCADEDKEVGMALGLGLGTALGLALGLGLGLTVAAGAFLAVGLLEMLVPDPQEFRSDPRVHAALKSALLKLAGPTSSGTLPIAVKLNWGVAKTARTVEADTRHRGLLAVVTLGFKIHIQSEEDSLGVCQVLSSRSREDAEKVIKKELQEAGVPGSIKLVNLHVAPNPLSYNPNQPDPTEFVPTGVSLDEVAANPVESPKEHVANVQAPWSGSVSTTAQDSSEFVPTDVSLDEVVANSAAESPKKDVGSVAWCVVHGLPRLQPKEQSCAEQLVTELMAASRLPSLATMRPGSKLPSLEATEDWDAETWSDTRSSLGETALESQLQDLNAKRESLGDTLSTQEVLARQVLHDNASVEVPWREAPIATRVNRVKDWVRRRHSEVGRRALPRLSICIVGTELQCSKTKEGIERAKDARSVARARAVDRPWLRGRRGRSRG